MNSDLNILAAWVGILLGTLSGIVSGIFFHEERWLGGYDSWRRRLLRLGHVAFFQLGLLNLAWVFTVHTLRWSAPHPAAGLALAASVLLMPGVCYLSAWRKPFRLLFFIPVLCVLVPAAAVLLGRGTW